MSSLGRRSAITIFRPVQIADCLMAAIIRKAMKWIAGAITFHVLSASGPDK